MVQWSKDLGDLQPGDLPERMTYRDIAELLGVKVQTLHQYRYKDSSFPKKIAEVRSGIFDGEDVRTWLKDRSRGRPQYSSSEEELLVPGKELFTFDDLAQLIGVSASSLRTYKYDYDRDVFPKPAVNADTGRPYSPQQFDREDVLQYARFQLERLEGRGRIPNELLTRFVNQ
ncbi:helix-turn-helix domain-containing protein [Agrococcus casei]|uniref:Helix-turn-helix domain-containing protein n=1 Tax=Agrococcus casei LMG 22410 TaxID=1255656 RepID=A0A1R4FJ72_9MICO|nr:helix-turn-helix domain-containing protein [Agrococcus casei]SJM56050.1 hypothetical protein CZ674_04855 [Agrococcus casei LMG 22410]